jgi:hypothetical protein
MAAIYSNGGNRWNILGFNFTKRDALSSVYKISMLEHQKILLERRNSIRTTPVNDIKNRGAFMQVFAVDDSTERGPFILLLITKL